ncbi:hypothetical protein IC627_15045 [Photobacterium damselae subsp. piscicida]|uniref:Insertion element IS1 protein InsA helix-turn-helix domain-containing protein n=1 Tax=Photobacterium damsela subsp. piscicida TaxID=38294 RepID=A0A5F0YGE0_PHODP|nr:hypothetical protein [Photobacterium damselae subsp. piscicida]PSV58607.1 hypothetical protein CTT35_15665 [Photobacterium damselae]PSW76044.1 hypothetical protein CTT37_16245 [Photobacterium damselae]QOD52608.1 hypothetical protein IC628_15000 [Photobacterium damselae subsp. piscicida]QOD56458.1 hypothetical protein IC627_15045 [Photobacterium damselae subsp. piscicida]
MEINSSGVRVAARVLNVAYNTVLSTLKTLTKASDLYPFR